MTAQEEIARWKEAPQEAPGLPKEAPRGPQEAPKEAPEAPRWAQNGPRRGQDGAKMASGSDEEGKLKRKGRKSKNVEKP